MRTVPIHTETEYEAHVGSGLLSRSGEFLRVLSSYDDVFLCAGSNVMSEYGDKVSASLEDFGFRVLRHVIPAGEDMKTPETLVGVLEAAAGHSLGRDCVFVALGGGVCCDITGLAAALYMRGVKCAYLPTSLLAMSDASIGGKTAVNLEHGKNLMGAFSQPSVVLCDTDCLVTLSEREYRSGMAEIIKSAYIAGGEFWESIKNRRCGIEDAVSASLELKSALVANDPYDRGERRLLNLGHTAGHAIEAASHFSLTHGEAVSIGMACVARGCAAAGLCSEDNAGDMIAVLKAYGLPVNTSLDAGSIMEYIRVDKKRSGNSIDFIVPVRPGDCRIESTGFDVFRRLVSRGLGE